MTDLHLILHKVRGEPAFDVAECIGEDSDGEVWIIPTSGHRCYPYQSWPLIDLCQGHTPTGDLPEDWPDHYSGQALKGEYAEKWVPKGVRKSALAEILGALKLNKPSLIRRIPK